MEEAQKIKTNTPQEDRYLREYPFMAFGSMAQAIGRVFQGKVKEVTPELLEQYFKMAFKLAMDFTKEAFERVDKGQDSEEIEF